MQGNPFARSVAMMSAIAAAMGQSNVMLREAAMANIGPYRSRGKGSGKTSPSRHKVAMDRRGIKKVSEPKFSRSKYTPHTGAKEVERAKRYRMDFLHGPHAVFSENYRSAPTLCQLSKVGNEQEAWQREYDSECLF
jgi:hypothetical protein